MVILFNICLIVTEMNAWVECEKMFELTVKKKQKWRVIYVYIYNFFGECTVLTNL
jgi:hypothetical protein